MSTPRVSQPHAVARAVSRYLLLPRQAKVLLPWSCRGRAAFQVKCGYMETAVFIRTFLRKEVPERQ